jgi:hypothetical protein
MLVIPMITASPIKTILLGFVLCVIGVAVPFLTVLGMIPSNFVLLFLSYAASVGGLFLGIIGAASYIRGGRS